jgi:hypothetical protein
MKRHLMAGMATSALVLLAASCGNTVIGGIVPDPGDAGTTPDDAGLADDCYACACHRSSTDVDPGCMEVCGGGLTITSSFGFCNGMPADDACAACMAARCGVQDPTQCAHAMTLDECACSYPSTGSPAGCRDVCDNTIIEPGNYCDGAPPVADCVACVAERCGVDLETHCVECACQRTSGDTPMGCADTCDADIAGQPTPNFCNGGPVHSQCDACILARCGVDSLSECQ